MKLLVLGGGFTGMAVARRARARGAEVVATTRSDARAVSLRELGVVPLVASTLDEAAIAAHIEDATGVIVTIPPDAAVDADLARLVTNHRKNKAISVAYVSSTGVYGDASGKVDESTAVDRNAPRSAARLAAETTWRDAGGAIVRAPGIYGPGRGIHLRLARGEIHSLAAGTNFISRIHVEDLAAALLAAVEQGIASETFVIGDLEPAPHADVVRFVCAKMAIAPPLIDPAITAPETLRHDRRVDSTKLRERLRFTLEFPTYREGYTQCIARDGLTIS